MEIEQEKSNMEDNSNGINDNRTNQNNEENTYQSGEDARMILQSDELLLNHNIIIEKCNVFEDGSCHVYSNKLAPGVAIRVDDPKVGTWSTPQNVLYGIVLVVGNQPLC